MLKNGGLSIEGIATLHSKGTFLVTDRRTKGDGKIYECSLTWGGADTHVDDCDVFAYKPEGVDWDPVNVEVDVVKELVYVADLLFNSSSSAPSSSTGTRRTPSCTRSRCSSPTSRSKTWLGSENLTCNT